MQYCLSGLQMVCSSGRFSARVCCHGSPTFDAPRPLGVGSPNRFKQEFSGIIWKRWRPRPPAHPPPLDRLVWKSGNVWSYLLVAVQLGLMEKFT